MELKRHGRPAQGVGIKQGSVATAIHAARSGFPQRWQLASARAVIAWHA